MRPKIAWACGRCHGPAAASFSHAAGRALQVVAELTRHGLEAAGLPFQIGDLQQHGGSSNGEAAGGEMDRDGHAGEEKRPHPLLPLSAMVRRLAPGLIGRTPWGGVMHRMRQNGSAGIGGARRCAGIALGLALASGGAHAARDCASLTSVTPEASTITSAAIVTPPATINGDR